MTRTERSVFPRAVLRDRSESKSGMDKSFRKGGAGTHNWGSLADEADLEYDAINDEQVEMGIAKRDEDSEEKPALGRRTSSTTDEERTIAREFRRRALSKDGIDLASIARTSSAVATSNSKKSPVEISSEIPI